MADKKFEIDDSAELGTQSGEVGQATEPVAMVPKPDLPIFSILDRIDFADHFVIIGDVGTGKSTATPIYEFEKRNRDRQVIIREPSRASCNALYYSLMALHPEVKDELAVITKDTKMVPLTCWTCQSS